jgi:O-antigen ligase
MAPRRRVYPRLEVSAETRLLMWLALAVFFIMAGNIAPVADEPGKQSAMTSVVRGFGLVAGSGALVMPLMIYGAGRLNRLIVWLGPLLFLLAFCVLSASWSIAPSATLIRSSETTFTIVFAALWTHLAGLLRDPARQMCRAIALGIVGVAIYGLAVNTVFFGTPFRFIVSFEESERPRFVFGGLHPLGVGDILAIGAIAALLSDLKLMHKVAFLPVLLGLLYLTDSTGARFLVAGVFLLYAGICLKDTFGYGRLMIVVPIFAVAGVIAIAILFSLEVSFTRKVASDDRLWTLTGRTELWRAIWDSGLASTWFGTGFDASRGAILRVFGIAYQVHNQYLAILVELGYVGVFIFVCVFAIWLAVIARSRNFIVYCFALYVLGINMDNASMLSKTWLIFLSTLCYIFTLERTAESASLRQRLSGVRWRPVPAYSKL